MAGFADVETTLAERPRTIRLAAETWDKLDDLWSGGRQRRSFNDAFNNGRAFLVAEDGLRGREPRLIEWTGGRKAPGDEVVPADLRVDHVYMISCKYLSKILHNLSPSRLFDVGLSREQRTTPGDWFQRVSLVELQKLYDVCISALDLQSELPALVQDTVAADRRFLAQALKGPWPEDALPCYLELCSVTSERTAALWSKSITARNRERWAWRLLRIGSAPYYVLGVSSSGSMRFRVATPWDFKQRYEVRDLVVGAEAAGQTRLSWAIHYRDLVVAEDAVVCGHVELRWGHGRFGGPPEAKVYLDTKHEDAPGYFNLEGSLR